MKTRTPSGKTLLPANQSSCRERVSMYTYSEDFISLASLPLQQPYGKERPAHYFAIDQCSHGSLEPAQTSKIS